MATTRPRRCRNALLHRPGCWRGCQGSVEQHRSEVFAEGGWPSIRVSLEMRGWSPLQIELIHASAASGLAAVPGGSSGLDAVWAPVRCGRIPRLIARLTVFLGLCRDGAAVDPAQQIEFNIGEQHQDACRRSGYKHQADQRLAVALTELLGAEQCLELRTRDPVDAIRR